MTDHPQGPLRRGAALLKGFLRGLWSEEGSITQKSVRGGVWIGASSAVSRLLQALQTAILARLLIPADFGLMRLAVDGIAFAAAFSQFGVNTALVQRKELDDRYLQTAWTMDLFRNLLMFGVTMVAAGPLARLVLGRSGADAAGQAALLAAVIRLVAIKYLFMGLSNNTGVTLLHREMNYRRKQIYEVCLSVGGVAFTVAMGLWLRSVWALAWGQVLYGVGEFVGSYIIHPFRPRFRFYWKEASELFNFGKHIFVSSVLGFVRGSFGTLLLGYLLGAEAVGYYSLGRSLVVLPVGAVLPALTGVLYPAFSHLQDDKAALRRGLRRVLGLGTLVVGPMLVGIAVTAGPLVRLLYGPDYMPAATVAVLFCAVKYCAFATRPMHAVLLGRGRPGMRNVGTVADIAVFLATVFPLVARFGLPGMVVAVGLGLAAELVVSFILTQREIEVSLLAALAGVARPAAASLLMGTGVLGVQRTVAVEGPAVLLVLVPAGVLFYLALSAALNWPGACEAVGAFKRLRHA